jgi:hypothetical protein
MPGVLDRAISFTVWTGLGTVNCRSVHKANKNVYVSESAG